MSNRGQVVGAAGLIMLVSVLGFLSYRYQLPNADGLSAAANLAADAGNGTSKKTAYLNLALEKKGTVSKVLVREGDMVKAGQSLVELNPSELNAQVHEKQATLQIELIKLKLLKNGQSVDTTKSRDAALAQTDLENSKIDLIDNMQDSYTRADDAVRDKIDQFILNAQTFPTTQFTNQLNQKYDYPGKRLSMEALLLAWKIDMDTLSSSSDLEIALATTKDRIAQTRIFLDTTAYILSTIQSDANILASSIRNWRTDLATARLNLNTGSKNLIAAEKKWREAQVKASAATDIAPDTRISLQEAKIKEIQAQIEGTQAAIDKMTLVAPERGLIKKVFARVGLYVPAGNTMVVLSP